MRSVALVLVVSCMLSLSTFGCTAGRGVNREALLESIQQHSNMATAQNLATTRTPERRLPMPYRLAIYFTHKDFPASAQLRMVDWGSADATVIQRALQPAKDGDFLQESFLLANSSVQGTTFTDIRSAAARYDADTILVIDGAAAVDRYNNGHAWWYVTGFGAYLAHGTESHALFIMEGTLWDTRSGHLYGTQRAEGETTLVGPATSLEDRAAIAEAKAIALERFGKAIAETLRLLKAKQRMAN